jgi:hypothetical protein
MDEHLVPNNRYLELKPTWSSVVKYVAGIQRMPTLNHYQRPDVYIMARNLHNKLQQDQHAAIEDAAADDNFVDYSHETVRKEVHEDAWRRMHTDWVKPLFGQNPLVESRVVTIQDGDEPMHYWHVNIGPGDTRGDDLGRWTSDEQIVGTLLFGKHTLGMERDHPPLIVSVTTNENVKLGDSTTQMTALHGMVKFMGIAYPHNAFIFLMDQSRIQSRGERDDNGQLQTFQRVFSTKYKYIAAHEIAHFVDDSNHGTLAHREGFAVSMHCEFNFEEAKQFMRNRLGGYGRLITAGILENVLGREMPPSLTTPELYGIPGTFFCYVYNKIGPRKFAEWYRLLAGDASAREHGTNSYVILPDSIHSPDGKTSPTHHGKPFDALEVACRHAWADRDPKFEVQKMVSEYLQLVNS